MTPSALIARARSALGRKVVYRLGAGGMAPKSVGPEGSDGACDCSGYVAWALGISRQTNDPFYLHVMGGWINTTAIVADAKDPSGLFTRIANPKPGCLILYAAGSSGRANGHVGIVTTVIDNAPVQVIHCASGNFKRTGDAIQETHPGAFTIPGVIFAWYDALEVEP